MLTTQQIFRTLKLVAADTMGLKKNTTEIVTLLRGFMKNPKYVSEAIQAYIVPSNDAHNSEYIAEYDELRAFISGFTGSAGTAIVTDDKALMWTDGRYYLQAGQEMDSNWTLMKEGEVQTPSQGAWLLQNLPAGSKIGVDPKLYPCHAWISLKKQLESKNHQLIPVKPNLVDLVWTEWANQGHPPRPKKPANPVLTLARQFTGASVASKLAKIRAKMQEKKAELLVLTALDEIAYTLNLRGSDIAYNPVFFAYLVIKPETFVLFVNNAQITDDVKDFLSKENDGNDFSIREYEEIDSFLKSEGEKVEGFVWFSDHASFFLTWQIPYKHLATEITPVALMKAVKNPVEIQGMKQAHIKDAAALCRYFAWLEKEIKKNPVTEISGADKLEEFRKEQQDFVGLSFPTISSVDSHGAIIHYHPMPDSDIPIKNDSIYLCDSGAQFRDGTTDVTRTLHMGTPTKYHKECYTRVLKGQIKLATSVFPMKIKGNYLDSFARQYLWEVGLDYAHGTGHGIGSYLNVHEGPMGISWRPIVDDPGLEPGMFISNEPGYYQDGEFGIRIEDIVLVVLAETPHSMGKQFLTFETVTLVPKQTKFIDLDLLSQQEVDYLNKYHKQCRDVIGAVLDEQGHVEAKEWLYKETEPLVK